MTQRCGCHQRKCVEDLNMTEKYLRVLENNLKAQSKANQKNHFFVGEPAVSSLYF